MLGRKAVFGRHGRSRAAPAPILRAQADADGVARVFPRELWEDPRIGGFLREMGFSPDDPDNLLPDPQTYYRDRFADARRALDARIAALREAAAARSTGAAADVRVAPLLLIDLPAWRGRFGHMLCEQLGLVAWDEWNVLLLAEDEASAAASGLPLHPGTIPALNVRVIETLHALQGRLEAQADPSNRAASIELEITARDHLLGYIAVCRDQVEALLGDSAG